MVYATCNNCGHKFHWEWIEAFSKFGFNDGDGQVETQSVAFVLEDAGYTAETWKWGVHNELIVSLTKGGKVYVSNQDCSYDLGYDNPKAYLPKEIIGILNKAFPITSIYRFP